MTEKDKENFKQIFEMANGSKIILKASNNIEPIKGLIIHEFYREGVSDIEFESLNCNWPELEKDKHDTE